VIQLPWTGGVSAGRRSIELEVERVIEIVVGQSCYAGAIKVHAVDFESHASGHGQVVAIGTEQDSFSDTGDVEHHRFEVNPHSVSQLGDSSSISVHDVDILLVWDVWIRPILATEGDLAPVCGECGSLIVAAAALRR